MFATSRRKRMRLNGLLPGMKSMESKQTFADRIDALLRRRPILFFVIVAALAFICGPLFLAASRVTAVLYQVF